MVTTVNEEAPRRMLRDGRFWRKERGGSESFVTYSDEKVTSLKLKFSGLENKVQKVLFQDLTCTN